MTKFQLTCHIFLLTYVVLSSSAPLEIELNTLRLPKNTAPRSYNIQLNPDIDNENFTFTGASTVTFDVLQPTNIITVHVSRLIEIDENYTQIVYKSGVKEKPVSQEWNKNWELFHVKFNQILQKGSYNIEFKWKGIESVDYTNVLKQGFLRRKISDGRYVVAAQLKPRGARSVFPCWDEPGYRAEFKISMKHHPKYVAISNMPVEKTAAADDGKIWTAFEKTPALSPHMINFVVGPYSKVTNEYGNVTLWTLGDEVQQMAFIQKLSPLMARELEHYTGIEYPLPVLNNIYVPKYPRGANDHFGINIFSDSILFDPEVNSGMIKQFTKVAVAQPIAHQWFGNLVTNLWWDDVWLSEALSMFFGCKLLDNVLQEITGSKQYISENAIIARILYIAERTSGKNRQVISMPQRLDDIDDAVTSVTRFKGISILQMLEHILSEDVFRNGFRKYLSKHKFGSATSDDLWASLQAALDEKTRPTSRSQATHDIKSMMDPWLRQTGYPLLNVTRDYDSGVVTITQSAVSDKNSTQLWLVPVTFATSSKPDFSNTAISHWLHDGEKTLKLPGIPKDDWIILNLQLKDFYQVAYDRENWRRIANHLDSEKYHEIHVLNRVQLLNDIQRFSLENEDDVEIILKVLWYLRRETDVLPYLIADEFLNSLAHRLINTPIYGLYKKFVLNILKRVMEHLNDAEREHNNNLNASMRQEMLRMACHYGDKKCKDMATVKLMETIRSKKPINYDDKQWVYCAGLSTADEDVWESVVKAHYENPKKNPNIYEYLGCTKNHSIINKYLKRALDTPLANGSDSSKDAIYDACQSLTSESGEQYNFAINFFTENADKTRQYYSMRKKTDGFARIIRCLTFMPKTSEHKIMLEKLIKEQRASVEKPEVAITEMADVIKYYKRANDAFSTVLKRNAKSYGIL